MLGPVLADEGLESRALRQGRRPEVADDDATHPGPREILLERRVEGEHDVSAGDRRADVLPGRAVAGRTPQGRSARGRVYLNTEGRACEGRREASRRTTQPAR
jgi:hypothetical protein